MGSVPLLLKLLAGKDLLGHLEVSPGIFPPAYSPTRCPATDSPGVEEQKSRTEEVVGRRTRMQCAVPAGPRAGSSCSLGLCPTWVPPALFASL